jgi:hypothetical protein
MSEMTATPTPTGESFAEMGGRTSVVNPREPPRLLNDVGSCRRYAVPLPRPSVRCGFGHETFAGAAGNGQDAP